VGTCEYDADESSQDELFEESTQLPTTTVSDLSFSATGSTRSSIVSEQEFEEITCVEDQYDVVSQTRSKMFQVGGEHDFLEITNVDDQLNTLLQTENTACMLQLGSETVSSNVVLACDDASLSGSLVFAQSTSTCCPRLEGPYSYLTERQ